MSQNQKGICYLVGAGPGDLGLVTLKARECVERADVVVYDYLCNPAILKWTRPGVEVIYAGKRSGDHTMTQEQTNALLVEKTREGKVVVRLKGGDPFLFGRGGEEAEALSKAKLRFEIIPGISSAFAVPAYAGIPLTHRNCNSQVTIFTGHEYRSKPGSELDYKKLAETLGTKVMLMGVERIGQICANLMAEGADPNTPVALVRWGTTGSQQTLAGTLADIGQKVAEGEFAAPAVAIFGEVVKLRSKLSWFENRPLFGKRIVVTRTSKQAGSLSFDLGALGADVLELPTIRIEPPKDIRGFAELVQDSHMYDWIIFTSANGVNAFFDMFYKLYDDAREIGGVRIAAIGAATAQRLKEFHLKVDLLPEEYVAESIVKAFKKECSLEHLRLLLVRPEVARDVVASQLTKEGAIVDEAIAYQTLPENADVGGGITKFKAEGADMITFTSSSTVQNFMALKLPLAPGIKTASIGPITSKTMRELGLKVDVEASKHDIPGLVKAIARFYQG
jgi:uroporphyrinogen III methyltransferase/synthase